MLELQQVFKGIAQHITIFLSLVFLYGFIKFKLKLRSNFLQKIFTGIIFSAIAWIAMLSPIEVYPGSFVDGRIIIVGIAGAYGGLITGITAGILVALIRFSMGGIGVAVGCAGIIGGCLVGLAFYYIKRGEHYYIKPRYLILLGVLLTAQGQLLAPLFLPMDIVSDILRHVSIPGFILYPIGTLFIGSLLNYFHEYGELILQKKESEELYRALFDNTPLNTIVVDKEGKITDFKFPEHPEQIAKPRVGDLMYVDYAKYNQKDMYRELIDSIDSGKQKEFLDLEYDNRFLHIRISPFKDGAIITALDTTPIRELESQLHQSQKLESIGTLAGGIAHDFNNILSPILLHSEMIMYDLSPDDSLNHDIKEIYKAGKRARDLVQQILIFARKGLEEKIVLKSSHILKEAIKFLRSTIPATIDIQCDIKAEQDTILADPTQLNQIVMNLCTNAAHAMRENGGLLEVILDNEEISKDRAKSFMNLKPGQYLKLSVKDNGTGIAPDIKDKIFEPYFTTKGVGEGTGFGLATTRSIVQKYGGDMIVKSEVGKGSTFDIYLPLEKAEAQDLKEDNKEIPMGNEHILFVDDEPSIVNIMQKSLEKYGYKITGRTSSVEALEAFSNNPDKFDLVITDMTMPNMTGEELAEELMSIKPDIRVILCTGFSDKIDKEKAEEIGISSFVMKPIIAGEIANTIRDVLDKS